MNSICLYTLFEQYNSNPYGNVIYLVPHLQKGQQDTKQLNLTTSFWLEGGFYKLIQ
jgi:hypothetical protein